MRMSESQIGEGVWRLREKRGDTLMSTGVTPPEEHVNNVPGPDR